MKTKSKNIKNLRETLWKYVRQYLLLKYPACEICNKRESIEGHHIIKKSVCEFLRFDLINLIAVCRTCHNKAHPERRYAKAFDPIEWNEILLRLIGNEGIVYLNDNRHNIKNWWSVELEDLIAEFKQKIKNIEKN